MISIIAAMTRNRVIGIGENKLPWRIDEEVRVYRNIIQGSTVIMGRSTFNAYGKPIPGCNNIVVSHSMPKTEGVDVCGSFEEAIEKANGYGKETFVLGGAAIFAAALPVADRMIISYIKRDYPGDKFFPEFDLNDWEVERRHDYYEFQQVIYLRRPAGHLP